MLNQVLSLCIPTYNRAAVLNDYLRELAPQAARYSVNIYISDNASTDNTEQVVRTHMQQFSNIVYSRNGSNLGHEHNFMKVLRMAHSEYAWLLGDDDRIVEDAVEKMLKLLSNSSYDLVLVNGGRKSGNKVIGRVIDKLPQEYFDQNRLLVDLGWHSTWISCLVFSRKMIREGQFEQYFNTSFLQFSVIFNYLAGKQFAVRWQSDALVYGLRRDLPAWIGFMFDTFGEKWIKAAKSLPDSYTLSAKNACIKNHGVKSGLFSFYKLFFFRLIGYYNLEIFHRHKKILPALIGFPLWGAYAIAAFPFPRIFSNRLLKTLQFYLSKRKKID